MAKDSPNSAAMDAKLTIVIGHGAFADASSWNGVIERLQEQDYDVVAPPNPLRGVALRLCVHCKFYQSDRRPASYSSPIHTGEP